MFTDLVSIQNEIIEGFKTQAHFAASGGRKCVLERPFSFAFRPSLRSKTAVGMRHIHKKHDGHKAKALCRLQQRSIFIIHTLDLTTQSDVTLLAFDFTYERNYHTMKYNKFMKTLSIELTRRCNMKCKFCSRGESQELDISKEIIDKTLDELSDTYIRRVIFWGGEPFLAQDKIQYLINALISKKISVGKVSIITNGTIKLQDRTVQCIFKLTDYLRYMDAKYHDIESLLSEKIHDVIPQNGQGLVNITISDLFRSLSEHESLDLGLKFDVLKQDTDININNFSFSHNIDDLGVLVVCGRGKDNASEILKELHGDTVNISHMRVPNNNFCIMRPLQDVINNVNNSIVLENAQIIIKSLTVSANGNVFPGCSEEYKEVDKEPIFNIMDVNGNFFDKIQEFCWKHLIFNENATSLREIDSIVTFCDAKGITLSLNPNDKNTIRELRKYIDEYEQMAYALHKSHPHLDMKEIELLAISLLCKKAMLINKKSIEEIRGFLEIFSDFDDVQLSLVSKELFGKLILTLEGVEKDRCKNA